MIYHSCVGAVRSIRVTRTLRKAGVGGVARFCRVSPVYAWALGLCIFKGFALSEAVFHRHQEPSSSPDSKTGNAPPFSVDQGAVTML
jgi:hypothetical protein